MDAARCRHISRTAEPYLAVRTAEPVVPLNRMPELIGRRGERPSNAARHPLTGRRTALRVQLNGVRPQATGLRLRQHARTVRDRHRRPLRRPVVGADPPAGMRLRAQPRFEGQVGGVKLRRVAIRIARRAGIALLFVIVALLGIASGVLFAYADDVDKISALDDYAPSTISRVFGAQGEIVGEFAIQRREVIPYEAISPQTAPGYSCG